MGLCPTDHRGMRPAGHGSQSPTLVPGEESHRPPGVGEVKHPSPPPAARTLQTPGDGAAGNGGGAHRPLEMDSPGARTSPTAGGCSPPLPGGAAVSPAQPRTPAPRGSEAATGASSGRLPAPRSPLTSEETQGATQRPDPCPPLRAGRPPARRRSLAAPLRFSALPARPGPGSGGGGPDGAGSAGALRGAVPPNPPRREPPPPHPPGSPLRLSPWGRSRAAGLGARSPRPWGERNVRGGVSVFSAVTETYRCFPRVASISGSHSAESAISKEE